VSVLTAPFLTAAFVATLVRLMHAPGTAWIRTVLAPVGRIALTNYLAQSVVGIILFTGVGLGLAGRVSPPLLFLLAFVVFRSGERPDRTVPDRRIRGDVGTAHACAGNGVDSHGSGAGRPHCVDELLGPVGGGDHPVHRGRPRTRRPGVSASAVSARLCRLHRTGGCERVVVEESPLRPGRVSVAVVHHMASTGTLKLAPSGAVCPRVKLKGATRV